MTYQIYRGIKPEHRVVAAHLYAKAFAGKFLSILGDHKRVTNLFSSGINTQRGISAISSNNELLGLVGFQYHDTSLIDIQLKDFTREYGLIVGMIKAAAIAILFDRKPDNPHQLMMDGIVVREESRGQGIGKRFFAELEHLAQSKQLTSIKLDVIDANPKAKRLYEKIGFAAVKHQTVPNLLTRWVGVRGVTTMIKRL